MTRGLRSGSIQPSSLTRPADPRSVGDMNKTAVPSAQDISPNSIVSLTDEYASKCQLTTGPYRVIGTKQIGKAFYSIVEYSGEDVADDQKPAIFRVHPKHFAMIAEPKPTRASSHSSCTHPKTKSARALCRRQRNEESK